MSSKKKELLRYIIITLVVSIIFTIDIDRPRAYQYTNYNGITMTNEEYFTLLNLGFTDDEIYYMNEETFQENKDADATLVAREVKYYKTVYPTYGNSYTIEVSPLEYYQQNQNTTLGTVTTQYKIVTSTISANGSKYRYKVSEAWRQIPSVKSYDIIGVGFDGNVHVDSTVYFFYYVTNSSGVTSTNSDCHYKTSSDTGASTIYKIPSSFVGLSSTLYYDVSKDNPSDTITGLEICGDYAHATQTVTAAQASNRTINISGLHLGASIINKYDEIPCAPAYASVNW